MRLTVINGNGAQIPDIDRGQPAPCACANCCGNRDGRRWYRVSLIILTLHSLPYHVPGYT